MLSGELYNPQTLVRVVTYHLTRCVVCLIFGLSANSRVEACSALVRD